MRKNLLVSSLLTMTATVVVSNDNKTLTVTQAPTDVQASSAGSVAVYDRQ